MPVGLVRGPVPDLDLVHQCAAEVLIYRRRWASMMGDISTLQPPIVVCHPPNPDRTRAGELIRLNHAPMIEGKVVVAPASFSAIGRPEIPAGSAFLDEAGKLLGQWAVWWDGVDRWVFTGGWLRLLDLRLTWGFWFR
ncbi:MAG TPA: hypothetical protein VFS96_01365 [Nitrolancea sp.]|nr:hypothetical protein [Nitrolancea sp.]